MVNKVTLIGRVGKDPEVKHFDNGGQVSNFSLACSEQWKNKDGERQESTEWVNISIFGKLAEIAEKYVQKGTLLYVEGKLKTRTYDKDGEKRYVTEVVLQDFGGVMKMLSSKSEAASVEATPSATNEPIETDDLPF